MDVTKMAAMFGIMAGMGEGTPEEKIDREADIYFKTPGIIKPDDWDTLSFEDKQNRVSRCREVARSE